MLPPSRSGKTEPTSLARNCTLLGTHFPDQITQGESKPPGERRSRSVFHSSGLHNPIFFGAPTESRSLIWPPYRKDPCHTLEKFFPLGRPLESSASSECHFPIKILNWNDANQHLCPVFPISVTCEVWLQ
ncbi:MAG TPA: hypothetical protein DDX19_11145 [Rhodopirellula baltica]|nr:hypothetical protein [Rhodopirellula baltica]